MAAPKAFFLQNRLQAGPMSTTRAADSVEATSEALGVLRTTTGFFAAVIAVLAVGLAGIGLFSAQSVQPFALTILAFFAALGLFFLFGLLAGQIRLTARSTAADAAQAAADTLGDGLQLTAADGKIIYANPAMASLYGTSAAPSLEHLFAGEPRAEEALYRLLRASERGEPRTEEIEFARSPGTGEPGWVSLSVSPIETVVGGAGGDGFTLWRYVDVTRERHREAEARRTGDHVLATYDTLPAGLLVVDSTGRVLHANLTLRGWLGIEQDRGQPLTLKLADILTPESSALLAASHGTAIERLDLDFVGTSGRGFPAAVVAAADSAGGWSAVVFHRSLAPPRDGVVSELAARRLFQAAPFGIATLDSDGRVVSANATLARLLLLSSVREQTPVLDLLARPEDGEARRALDSSLKAALEGKAVVPLVEIAVGAKGEFTRRVFMKALPEGGSEAALVYVVDSTEQRVLEEKYAQSQKMEAVGKLAGGIAHDFNNVLTAIIGWSDLLLGTQRPGDPAFQNVMNIKSSANRAAGLVNQLLAFSRRQTLQPEVLQLGEVLTDLSVLMNRLLGEKIQLKIHQGRDLWSIKADRTQFGQVMINLAVNARDAMAEGGTLYVRARNVTEREARKLEAQGTALAGGEYVLVEVEDTGVGMEPSVLAKIFEPFFTTKGVGKGTGLGLSTVYGIVRQTGGHIAAESTPGQGTIFRVYLPRHVVEPEEEVAAQKPAKKAAKDLTGRGRVLLVEDEDAVRSFAVEALKRQGYEVFEAASGAEAIDLMTEIDGKVDIVVSDVIMPEMDGPTMITELRKREPDLKVIFVSGYPDDAFKNNLEPDAKFAFLPKPFSLAQLAAKVKDELAK